MPNAERQIVHNTVREKWRVFFAISLDESVRANLMGQIKRLRESVPHAQASWSRKENIHLTLKFLGEIETCRLGKLSNGAARAVRDFSPFQITLEESGVFPRHGTPRVLWIGIKDESGKLAELHARLEEECAGQGFPREDRPFQPHLTIARLRKPLGARDLAAAHYEMRFETVAVAVAELLVIRSEPGVAGSRYTVVSNHRLEG
ncbi:hypothetical protein BH18ACI4_BH18ACI4_28570 [soil metagenome]